MIAAVSFTAVTSYITAVVVQLLQLYHITAVVLQLLQLYHIGKWRKAIGIEAESRRRESALIAFIA